MRKWLRLKTITPANFGAGSGSTTIDNPVITDCYTGLPFIPDSTIKGVIAGLLGNVPESDIRNDERTQLFGAPDGSINNEGEFVVKGNPSKFIFGDGELTCFPILSNQGERIYVFPLPQNISILKEMGITPSQDLYGIDEGHWCGKTPKGYHLSNFIGTNIDSSPIFTLSGIYNPAYWIIAGNQIARKLWLSGKTIIQQTSLESHNKRVKPQSLRCTEFIPEGSVFISRVSANTQKPLNYNPVMQMGGLENIGKGFLSIDEITIANNQANPNNYNAGPNEDLPSAFSDISIFISNLEQGADLSKLLTYTHDFGVRWRMQGFEKTLSFCLAKASSESGKEYRLLLAAITQKDEWETDIIPLCKKWAAGKMHNPAILMERILWLRRILEAKTLD